MGELLIYKASAGSGKTFTLVVEYIKHLIRNPYAYRQILAVTFTNKATTEMKERILAQLYGIWKKDAASQPYLKKICEKLQKEEEISEEEISRRAGIALQYMLHDYSRFRIETIDSFFQSVMRNLARELELSPNLNIELNNIEVLNNAVDSMIEKLTPNSPVLAWLLEYIHERIDNDKKWNVSDEIKKFGTNIFEENYIERGEALREKLKSIDFIKRYRQELRDLEKGALQEMRGYQEQFEKELEGHALSEEDLSNKSKGISSYFRKIGNDKLTNKDVMNATLEKHLKGAEAWVSKTHKRRNEIIQLVSSSLLPLLQEVEKKRVLNNRIINSCRLSLQHINQLQLLNHIDEEVRTSNHEHNRFLLSDTNTLLHSLMREGDSSFVFEKIGTQICHVMIDEFQDTSRMQWENFRLLLLEGLSQGADSLIVGDVKQSIYRWRNGDWKILNELGNKLPSPIPYPTRIETLETNRRSETRIINFNNALFQKIVGYLNQTHKDELNDECLPLQQAYADVAQKSPKTELKGYVKSCFVEPSEECDYTQQTLIEMGKEVGLLLEKGVRLSDIAILVRKNKNIPLIAQYFGEELGISVVSDEAFRLDASEAVCLLIDALRVISNPQDKISNQSLKYKLSAPINWEKLKLLPLYNMLEELYLLLQLDKIEKQDGYLLYFFDAVTEYLQRNTGEINDFIKYWEECLCSKTIPGGNIDGIRIYSIHKSKGLEFHTVLLPFCDWKIENEATQLVWCSPDIQPYNQLDLVPMNYSITMAESIYRNDYLNERLQLWVDNLNLLYVALTRAGKNLLIWSKKGQKHTMSELLSHSLPQIAQNGTGEWDEENGIYEYGELYPSSTFTEEPTNSVNRLSISPTALPIQMYSRQPDVEFRQSNRSADFIANGETDKEPQWKQLINHGNLLHNVFSHIKVASEADDAITRLVFEGIIGSREEEKEIRNIVHEALSHPQVADWYSGRWKLFNECDIIWKDSRGVHCRRPDRVMIRENEVIVVDFKFGQPRKSHHKQVQGYIQLLKRMGYNQAQITGYLWYVENKIIEQV